MLRTSRMWSPKALMTISATGAASASAIRSQIRGSSSRRTSARRPGPGHEPPRTEDRGGRERDQRHRPGQRAEPDLERVRIADRPVGEVEADVVLALNGESAERMLSVGESKSLINPGSHGITSTRPRQVGQQRGTPGRGEAPQQPGELHREPERARVVGVEGRARAEPVEHPPATAPGVEREQHGQRRSRAETPSSARRRAPPRRVVDHERRERRERRGEQRHRRPTGPGPNRVDEGDRERPAISEGTRSSSGELPSRVVSQEAMKDSGGVISAWAIPSRPVEQRDHTAEPVRGGDPVRRELVGEQRLAGGAQAQHQANGDQGDERRSREPGPAPDVRSARRAGPAGAAAGDSASSGPCIAARL